MQAAQVVARGQVALVDAPIPSLRPGHVRVRTRRLSLCGSDIRMLHHAPEGAYPFPPGTSGHEMVGYVEAISPADAAATGLQVGDAVLALAPGHEAMAEFYVAPVELVLPLPPGQPLELLLQAQQLGTVLFASKLLPNLVGKTVAIVGQGSAGLFFAWHLRRMGARRVIALDLEASRLEHSPPFGATDCLHNVGVDAAVELQRMTGGELADVVVEAAGEVDAINLAVDLVRHGGDILFFGYPRGQILPLNFELLFHKCCRAQTIVGATVEPQQLCTRMALDLVASGAVDVGRLITHHFPLADVAAAYELHRTRADRCLKVVIEMPE